MFSTSCYESQGTGRGCGKAATISHTVSHTEFKQASRTLGTGADSGRGSLVEGELPQDIWKQAENSSSVIELVTAVVAEPPASK